MSYPETPGYKRGGTSKAAADFPCILRRNIHSSRIRTRGESHIPTSKTNKCSACAVRVRDGYIAGESTFENMNTQSNENIGKKFGRWTVSQLCDPKYPRGRYLCKCECGTERRIVISVLEAGGSKMCNKHIRERNKTHGMKGTRVYKTWDSMKQRCYNSRHKSYADYGGRGIIICERWLHSFENFLADMGEPQRGQSIDRIDGNAGYYPENCRWATWRDQASNRRGNTFLTAFGESKTIAQWGRDPRCMVAMETLINRVTKKRNPWLHERAIITPARKMAEYVLSDGRVITNKPPRSERPSATSRMATVWRAV